MLAFVSRRILFWIFCATQLQLKKTPNEENKKNMGDPNVNINHLEDVPDLLSKKNGNPSVLPTFAPSGFVCVPPSMLGLIASEIMNLTDEIASSKAEVSENR